MHLSFESLTIIDAPSLQASLMDIHHNTLFKSTSKDESIFLASRARICSYANKGARLWLIVKPFIHSFHITDFTLTSMLRFCFDLI